MRAAVYHGPRKIRIEELPVPTPAAGELLVRVHANGICGTDASEFAAGPQMYPLHARHPLTGHEGPIVPGHEFCGIVVGAAADVDGFAEGDLVVTGAALWCGRCAACRAGRTSICDAYATVGLHRDGGLAQYVRVPAHVAVVAPAGLPPDVAALVQPTAIAVHALRRGGPAPGSSALVLGTGGIGAFLVAALVDAGVTVAATDVRPERLAVATALGAVAILDAPPPLVFEVTGTQAGLDAAVAHVASGGRVVTVGIAKEPLRYDARRVTTKELELVGTNALIGREDVPAALALLSRDPRRWSTIAPLAIPLDALVADGLLPMIEGRATRIKTLVDPWTAAPRPTVMERR